MYGELYNLEPGLISIPAGDAGCRQALTINRDKASVRVNLAVLEWGPGFTDRHQKLKILRLIYVNAHIL